MAKSNNALHVGIAQLVEPHIKKAQSDRISADIEAFLAKGGKIQKLGVTPLRWNNRTRTKKTKGIDPAFHRASRLKDQDNEETDGRLPAVRYPQARRPDG